MGDHFKLLETGSKIKESEVSVIKAEKSRQDK